MKLRFSDGIEIDTEGALRIERRADGLYVIGQGFLCAVDTQAEADALLAKLQPPTHPVVPVDATARDAHACDGCGRGLSPIEAVRWRVCMDCTRARHRAVIARGKCKCGGKRREGEVVTQGPRSWIPCRRCLGAIREVTP